MGKLIAYISVFLLGFLAAAWIYHALPPAANTGGPSNVQAVLNSTPNSAPLGPNDIVSAAARVEPAVVNIDTIGEPIQGGGDGFFGEDFPFGRPEPVIPKGAGSGVLISKDGYIVTNNHVVENAARITVRLTGSDVRHPAKVIGADAKSDLAVIKIDGSNFPFVQLGDSGKLRVGEWAIAVGNPLGLGTSVTVGVISATNRVNLEVEEGKVLERAIQTDAAINRGNSGGALANIQGQVIGINSAIASTSPGSGSIGIGFAIPINTVKLIAKELIAKGRVVRPWIGITTQPLTPDLRDRFRIPVREGAIIADVVPGSPAARAGLQVADVITEIDRKPIKLPTDISGVIRPHKVGDTLVLQIYREGRAQLITLKLAEMPAQRY